MMMRSDRNLCVYVRSLLQMIDATIAVTFVAMIVPCMHRVAVYARLEK